jgi:hypothetical protein
MLLTALLLVSTSLFQTPAVSAEPAVAQVAQTLSDAAYAQLLKGVAAEARSRGDVATAKVLSKRAVQLEKDLAKQGSTQAASNAPQMVQMELLKFATTRLAGLPQGAMKSGLWKTTSADSGKSADSSNSNSTSTKSSSTSSKSSDHTSNTGQAATDPVQQIQLQMDTLRQDLQKMEMEVDLKRAEMDRLRKQQKAAAKQKKPSRKKSAR